MTVIFPGLLVLLCAQLGAGHRNSSSHSGLWGLAFLERPSSRSQPVVLLQPPQPDPEAWTVAWTACPSVGDLCVCHIIWCREGPRGATTQALFPLAGAALVLPMLRALAATASAPPQPSHDLCGSGKAIRPRRLLLWLSLSQLALKMMSG